MNSSASSAMLTLEEAGPDILKSLVPGLPMFGSPTEFIYNVAISFLKEVCGHVV